MKEERTPLVSVDPAGEVSFRGEDRSEDAQEGEGGQATADAATTASERGQKLLT